MESLFNKLTQVLSGQYEITAALLEAAREHNQALRDSDHAAILITIKKQEDISGKLQEMDGKREEVLQQLTRSCRLEGQLVLSRLLPHAPDPVVAAELEEIAGGLKKRLVELAEVNQQNGILAERGLKITRQLSRIILPGGSNTYLDSGALRKENKHFSILNKTL